MTVPGDVLAGRYRLVHRIATGGMGSVWETWDELLQRRVAIKELVPQPGSNWDDAAIARSRVIREARITARLHHPHAVTLYDVIDHDGQPCLVLQYVPSRTLNSMLTEQGVLPVRFVTGVGAEVASALAAAHQVGVIHRDVKPSNVLITPAGTAMITDFGISHAAGDVSLTSTGMVTGTPAFLAPEVARGAPSGFPADVYSLGATLYAALEGTPPFGADQNPMAILHKVASGSIIPPRRSGKLTSLLGRMLATDPTARPAMSTVAQLLADLKDERPAPMLASEPQTIVVPPRTVRDWPTRHDQGGASGPPMAGVVPFTTSASDSSAPGGRRRPLGAVLAAALVLLVAGVGAWLIIGGSRDPQPAANSSVSLPSSSATSPVSALAPKGISAATSSSASAPPTTAVRQKTSDGPASTTSHPPRTASSTSRSGTARSGTAQSGTSPSGTARSSTARVAPTPAQLAAAITDYYALLPGNTDQAWAHLTRNVQTRTAQNLQKYQRVWDGIERVTATDAQAAGPDTVQATITYHFKDGLTSVEPTVFVLVAEGGMLKIDSETVLSSTTQ